MPRLTKEQRAAALSSFIEAAANGDLNGVRRFLTAGCRLGQCPKTGDRNALTAAATHGQHDVVQFLLDCGADPNEDKFSNFPLEACFRAWGDARDERHRYLPTLLALLKAGAHPTRSMLIHAVQWDTDITLVKALLQSAKSCRWYHDSFLPNGGAVMTAASNGGPSLEILRLLIQEGANLNHVNFITGTPLIAAIKLNREESVELLLQHGADPNLPDASGATPLLVASRAFPRLVKALLQAGSQVNGRGNIRLSDEIIEMEVGYGERIWRPYPLDEWTTPLIVASRLGQLDVVRVLLDARADRTLQDLEGKTALDWALIEGHSEVVSALR